MKKIFLLLMALGLIQQSFCQKSRANEQIGLSIPIIWNNTEIFNVYSGARAKFISGSAVSLGVNFNYSRNIFKNIFFVGGIGYYKQNFGIVRPFDFNGDTTTKYGYHTKKYSYGNINSIIGLRYNHELNRNYSLCGSLLFNGLYSIHQKYIPISLTNYAIKKYQVESNSFSFGRMLNLNLGANRKISKKLSVGVDLVLPLYTRFRKDRIFQENANEFYHSKFSIGTNISIKHNLHN